MLYMRPDTHGGDGAIVQHRVNHVGCMRYSSSGHDYGIHYVHSDSMPNPRHVSDGRVLVRSEHHKLYRPRHG